MRDGCMWWNCTRWRRDGELGPGDFGAGSDLQMVGFANQVMEHGPFDD